MIFGRMAAAGIQFGPLASDAEFLPVSRST